MRTGVRAVVQRCRTRSGVRPTATLAWRGRSRRRRAGARRAVPPARRAVLRARRGASSPTACWPRRSCRRCSCACGAIPSGSIPNRGSMRAFLFAQVHGRSVDLLRAESARRAREERDALPEPDESTTTSNARSLRAHARARRCGGRWPTLSDGERERDRARLLRRTHLPRGRACCSNSPKEP